MDLSWEDWEQFIQELEQEDSLKQKEEVYKISINMIGRHTGTGKRRGTREARMPTKVLWIRR